MKLLVACEESQRVCTAFREKGHEAYSCDLMRFALADIPKIAVENPRGYMSRLWRPADQDIHPYFFADTVTEESYTIKRTALWLKGLPPLIRTSDLPEPEPAFSPSGRRHFWVESISDAKIRSKTFPAVARAMAEQWG